jgi:predicted MPP superfamily phosphohydrolase
MKSLKDSYLLREVSIPQDILDRLGGHQAIQRQRLESKLLAGQESFARGDFHYKRYISINIAARRSIQLCGLSNQALRNVFDIRVVENEVILPRLPKSFDGFRLLHLTDLHCDLHHDLMQTILKKMQGVKHDAVVLTGDYHNETIRPIDHSVAAMRSFIPFLHPVRFATLGNHDFLAMVPIFESQGLPFLLNEASAIERSGTHGIERIWICGVDDAHYFKSHDLTKARQGIPKGECAILLSHTPETFREAAALDYDLHLSGHTHGGQICLPGGIPILSNVHGCRSDQIKGAWREGGMLGYTSPGTGSAGVAARFNCPPEITLHILRAFSI